MEHADGDVPLVVLIADSPESRLFIELSSYASDLAEAHGALDIAAGLTDPDSPLANARPYLVGFAVVAYCRCFLHSNVRKPLTEHIEVPPELLRTHELVRAFRNATIAHSQSQLAVTYPVGFLDRTTLEVKAVSGPTVVHTLPGSIVNDFNDLLEALQNQLDEVIEPIRRRLEARLRETDRGTLLAAAKPAVVHKLAKDFDPRTRRRPFPETVTFYWDSEDPDP